ncbi:MAG: xylose isomerase protein barrel, partial [Oscillospiraceae bacterium]|nr:xylose isomerase protein barrel [Oscillospiraceae bacterium]
MSKLDFGISSACLYPELTEKAVKRLGEAGVRNIEVFLNSSSETEKNFTQSIKYITEAYGINVLSVHPYTSISEPFMFFTDYERRFEDELERYKGFFNLMNQLDAKILVFHGDRKGSEFPNERYFERYAKLMEAAQSFGVSIAQENVARCKSSDVEFIFQMKKVLPHV